MTSMTRRVAILVGALVVAAAAVARADRIEAVPMRTPFASFPAVLGDWRVVSETPLADREHQDAERHATAMRRHREDVAAEIARLERRQDELLDELLADT